MSDLAGKVAIRISIARGIGAVCSRLFSLQGASVCIHYNNSTNAANQLQESIHQSGGRALTVQADISQPDQVYHMAATVIEAFGRIDILINNAGVALYGLFQETKDRIGKI